MPEYHQIETYIDLNSDLSEVRSKCAIFFEALGWLNPHVQEWLDGFAWEISEDGFVYDSQKRPLVNFQQLDMELMLLGWTPKIFPSLITNCVELEILIETEKVDDHSRFPQIRYTTQAQNTVWQIMREASNYFRDYGVFFTDEAQDSDAWEGLINKDHDKRWQFEMGIISPKWKSKFYPVRSDYFMEYHQEELWLARKFVMDTPPWR